jgi:hypothetical protein
MVNFYLVVVMMKKIHLQFMIGYLDQFYIQDQHQDLKLMELLGKIINNL